MEANRRGECQAEKLPERKDIHRKPLIPRLRVADIAQAVFLLSVCIRLPMIAFNIGLISPICE